MSPALSAAKRVFSNSYAASSFSAFSCDIARSIPQGGNDRLGARVSLLTADVQALGGIAIAARLVAAAIGHARDSFDPEVAVVVCHVPGERR